MFLGVVALVYLAIQHLVTTIVLPALPKLPLEVGAGPTSVPGIDWVKLDVGRISLPLAPFLLVAALPLFWILKHVSRLFVDNIVDARDAWLRAIMVETYLALVNMPEAKIGDQERAIVLQALFRPSGAQHSDDSVPYPLVDVLAEIKKRGP